VRVLYGPVRLRRGHELSGVALPGQGVHRGACR
jgi:hypothetical protein